MRHPAIKFSENTFDTEKYQECRKMYTPDFYSGFVKDIY